MRYDPTVGEKFIAELHRIHADADVIATAEKVHRQQLARNHEDDVIDQDQDYR